MAEEINDNPQSQKILNAAFACISKKGYANVSLRDIADEAGVVLSQLNYYYKNKEGLFNEVVKRLAQQYLIEIEAKLKNGESKKEKIACLMKYFQEMLKNKPELFKLLFDLSSMALWSASLRELLNNLFNDVAKLIETNIFHQSITDKENFQEHSAALSRIMLGAIIGTSIQVMLAWGQVDMMDSLSTIPVLFE
ncbi:MAG: TetR/AcrR family transcriptional regulator [Peptococcaceae bacterium]|nr:TetR/AcrR family transcriptional regulator [Peptococcaceae bacterium]